MYSLYLSVVINSQDKMKLLLLMLMLAATSSVQAFSAIADAKKSKATDYSICSVYFRHAKDKDKEKFFNDHGLEFVGRAKDSKNKRLRKWKIQIKKAKQRMTLEMKHNFEKSALTSRYGEKCNSIYTGSN